jgi:hypothetical protein
MIVLDMNVRRVGRITEQIDSLRYVIKCHGELSVGAVAQIYIPETASCRHPVIGNRARDRCAVFTRIRAEPGII